MPEIDWDTPLDGTGEERRAKLWEAVGLEAPELVVFTATMQAELSSEDWGYARLSSLSDPDQRALVSDQLLSAIHGLRDGLVAASLAVLEARELTGPNGVPFPDRSDSLRDMRRGEELRLAVAEFFDSFGTALDCLAAVLITLVRAPLSIQKADFGGLTHLDPDAAFATAFDGPPSEEHRRLWRELLAKIREAQDVGPDDWLDWSLEMRNALTHRGRITSLYGPRPLSGRILLPPTDQPQALLRYDLYLRRRPWLPEIEGMVAGGPLQDSVLHEPAYETLEGLRSLLVGFVEGLILHARAVWADVLPSLAAPRQRWTLPAPPAIAFEGVRPGPMVDVQGAIGGINPEHIRLAERVRVNREHR